jgi:hypothetical protein
MVKHTAILFETKVLPSTEIAIVAL